MFNILLEIFASEFWIPTNFIKNIKPFMFITILFYTVKKVPKQNLCNLLWPCTYNKPFVNIMTKRTERHFRFDGFIIIKNLINCNDRYKTGSNFLVKCERSGNILKEISKNRRLKKRSAWLRYKKRVFIGHVRCGNIKYLSRLVFFSWKRIKVLLKLVYMVLFKCLRLIERLFEFFILIEEIFNCRVVLIMKFVMKSYDIFLKVLLYFLVSLLFEYCKFVKINL